MPGSEEVHAIAPDPDARKILPGAEFGDSYELIVDEPALDAPMATRRVFARNPPWIARLMALRNAIVAPLGLKAAPDDKLPDDRAIGTFPLVSQTPERVVLGLDDRHLDFRVLVDVSATEDGRRRITATTFVKTHNLLGRIYLRAVTPFHRIIVPAMLRQAAKA